MSSFKNASQAQRRTHRERSQPAHRKKFGLLEKHKDYVIRAKDFNKKKTIIKQLKNIADEKNPDEYYRSMISSRVSDGKHQKLKDNSLSKEALKLFKTQDANYLTVKLQAENRKIERLQMVLHDTKQEKSNSHLVFVDSGDEEVDLEALEELPEVKEYDNQTHKSLCKQKKQQYSTLRLRKERAQSLKTAADKIKV